MNLEIDLSSGHKQKLLNLCIAYFPKTKLTIENSLDAVYCYKNHCVYIDAAHENTVTLGFGQHLNESNCAVFKNVISLHWYDLCMCELAQEMYEDHYETKMNQLFDKKEHVIDFLYRDYLEDKNINIRDYE